MLATVAGLGSCSKDNGTENPGTDPTAAVAYLAVAIETPKSNMTYANPSSHQGTPAEAKVTKAYAVTFDDQLMKLNVVSLTNGLELKVDANGIPNKDAAGSAFVVSPNSSKLMIVLNPSSMLEKAMNNATSFADFQQALVEPDGIDAITQDNAFTMINHGKLTGISVTNMDETPLVTCTPQVVKQGTMTKADAIAEAQKNAILVEVDRLSAKVGMSNIMNMDVDSSMKGIPADFCRLLGWQVNATNKSYLPYSSLKAYTDDDGALVGPGVFYRQDGNYSTLATPATEFNWLKNVDNVSTVASPISWRTSTTPAYVMENTMDVNSQKKGYTTKIVVKAQYTPEKTTLGPAITPGSTWCEVLKGDQRVIKSLAEMATAYSSDPVLKTLLDDIAVDAIGGVVTGSELITRLQAIDANSTDLENIGYIAAKHKNTEGANDVFVRIYRNSVCYYDILVMHNSNLTKDSKLGKWGVVRNNWYTLEITKVSQAGLPYIPDPTDDNSVPGGEIEDPDNPGPDDSDDDVEAYISVKIFVNPWTTWKQQVEL